MPSYPIKCDANTTPCAVTDFNIGIAENWLESARAGGGVPHIEDPELQSHIDLALGSCAEARARLREIIPSIERSEGAKT